MPQLSCLNQLAVFRNRHKFSRLNILLPEQRICVKWSLCTFICALLVLVLFRTDGFALFCVFLFEHRICSVINVCVASCNANFSCHTRVKFKIYSAFFPFLFRFFYCRHWISGIFFSQEEGNI